jgi:hypothetical protein
VTQEESRISVSGVQLVQSEWLLFFPGLAEIALDDADAIMQGQGLQVDIMWQRVISKVCLHASSLACVEIL